MKNLHEDDIIGSVRERLGRYEEAPSAELWEKITASQRKKDRVWPLWIEAISLVGMGLILYSLSFEVVEKKIVVENDDALHEKKVENQSISTEQKHSVAFKAEKQKLKIENETTQEVLPVQPESIKVDSTFSPIITQPEKPEEKPLEKPQEKPAEGVIPPYKKPKSKFQFYLSITPSLSFQKIIPAGNDELIVQGFENRSPLSMKRFGFGIDVGFQRDINHIFGFYGGLSYYRQNQQLTYFYYDKDADVTRVGDEWTFEITRQQHSKSFDYTMSNLGVSSGLLVTLKGEKLKHKFGAGLLFSQGFAKEAGSYNNSRSAYLSYQLFYRNEVRINDHFSWFIEPTFTYSFISKEKLSEPFVLKPYRAGIRAGVLYRF